MNEIARGRSFCLSPSEERSAAFSPPRRAVLVLGMHRSGTSALGGVISALGVAGPKTLADPNEWNPRGYFESPRIFTAHDELLAAIGSRWDDWRRLDPGRLDAEAGRHRHGIKELLIDEFGDAPLIFLKDPRICRFVPFTLSILADLSVSPVAVLIIRNPLEVAHSLQRRELFPLSKSVLLWIRHVLDAEFDSRDMPRCFLSYEDFLTDWRRQVERIAAQTGLEWPERSGSSAFKIDDFLTADLRRERFSVDAIIDHSAVVPLARDVYDVLTRIASQGESQELLNRLDLLRAEFNHACRTFEPALADAAAAERDLTSQREGLKSERGSLELERNSLILVRDGLRSERDRLRSERDGLRSERDKLVVACDSLRASQDAFVSEIEKRMAERDAYAAEYAHLIAARDALLHSRSWRLTAPLRFARTAFAGAAPGTGFIERLIVAQKKLWQSISRSVQ